MADGLYAFAQTAELLALPTEPCVESKRRLVEEFLLNPFLDDDIQGLALRAGIERAEAERNIADLCRDGLLKEAGQRGYTLDLEEIRAESVDIAETADDVAPTEGSVVPTEGSVVPQDPPLHVEMAAIHAHVQEELFARLRGEMVEPMLLIQQFLDNPDVGDLGQARAALEHINGFLEEYLLNSPEGGSEDTTPPSAA